MKKAVAIILAFSMIFVFAACGKNAEPEALPNATTAATDESAASEFLEASEEDFECLREIVLGILRSTPNNNVCFGEYESYDEYVELMRNSSPEDFENKYFYNSQSESALAEAMYMMWNEMSMGFFHFTDVEVDYDVITRYDEYEETGETCKMQPDPKGLFTDDFGYVKLNADQIDFILKNILCVEPDRTKTDDDFDTTGFNVLFDYYYSDGFYYYQYEEGGGGRLAPHIVDFSRQADGSYIIKLSSYDEDEMASHFENGYSEEYFYEVDEVSAALKEVDGKKVWSVSYLKPYEFGFVAKQ